MFQGRGAMYDLMARIGRNMDDCNGRSPLKVVRDMLGDAFGRLILIHANELSEADFRWLGRNRRKALSIVHCPRSHAYFGHSPFPLERLMKEGVNLCLGTDSLASNEDLSMFGEMRAMAQKFPQIHPRTWVDMATRRGARALGERGWEQGEDWIVIPSQAKKAKDVWEEIVNNGQLTIDRGQ